MTDDRRREREEAALDALIVLALRGGDEDGADEIDPADLPELSDEERVALEALGTPEEFVARMMAEADRRAGVVPPASP